MSLMLGELSSKHTVHTKICKAVKLDPASKNLNPAKQEHVFCAHKLIGLTAPNISSRATQRLVLEVKNPQTHPEAS
jgi:hypothetical protein